MADAKTTEDPQAQSAEASAAAPEASASGSPEPPGPISSRTRAEAATEVRMPPDAIVTDDSSLPVVPHADAAAIAAGLPFRTDVTKVLDHDPVGADDAKPVALDAQTQAQRDAEIARLEVVAQGSGDAAEAARASLRSLRHNGIRTDAQAIALEHVS